MMRFERNYYRLSLGPNSRIHQRCNRSDGISAKLDLSRINRPVELFLYEKSISRDSPIGL